MSFSKNLHVVLNHRAELDSVLFQQLYATIVN